MAASRKRSSQVRLNDVMHLVEGRGLGASSFRYVRGYCVVIAWLSACEHREVAQRLGFVDHAKDWLKEDMRPNCKQAVTACLE